MHKPLKQWISVAVFFIAAIFLLSLISCKKDEDNNSLPDPTNPIKTIMVYLDADNNLEEAGFIDFNEMESVDLSGSDVKVIVLIDGASYSSFWTGTRLYEVAYDSGGENSTVESNRLSSTELGLSATGDTDELNMGDPDTLSNFITFCKSNYQGNYALILWNHGGGWRKKNIAKDFSLNETAFPLSNDNAILADDSSFGKAVCWDETSNDDPLYVDEVQTAVKGKGLSVIGFDACLMGMIEVAYEIREQASYMIGSEETEPGDGWEYNDWLEDFIASSGKAALDMCNAVVSTYGDFYGSGSETTLAAIDLSKIDSVFSALNTFSLSLYNAIDTDSERDAVGNTLLNDVEYYCSGYGYDYNIDLYDMADVIQSTYDHNDTDCASLKTAVENCVVAEWHDPTYKLNSHGLAIHLIGTYYNSSSDYGLRMHPEYTNGNPYDYPVDFVQNSNNNWVARYSASAPIGPGLLYRIFFESL